MRLGILTGVETRHRYFVHRLRERFEVVAIGYETIDYSPADTSPFDDLTDEERRIVQAHYEERARQETLFFGAGAAFVEPSETRGVRRIEPGRLNDDETLAFLERRRVNALAIYGTNLIRSPLLERYGGRMINMHLGLSPYYRGTATNFYPLLNEEPEYVGATIHLIDAGIDSGPIIAHARPAIVEEDGPHAIGCKAILAGIDKMIDALHALDQGLLRAVPQWREPRAKLYLRKHFHPRHVVELHRKVERGLIPDYVRRVRTRPPTLRLIS